MRHRHLEGPYIATNDVNSVFKDRIKIQYAGLFTYKFWRNGKLVQQEDLQNDISELLKFEPGTTHQVKTRRFNPSNPKRDWVEDYTINVEAAEDHILSGCPYKTVKLTYRGSEHGLKFYIPELMLDVTPNQWGQYETIRKRGPLDGQKWPFNEFALGSLDYPNRLPTE